MTTKTSGSESLTNVKAAINAGTNAGSAVVNESQSVADAAHSIEQQRNDANLALHQRAHGGGK